MKDCVLLQNRILSWQSLIRTNELVVSSNLHLPYNNNNKKN
jgi:hypothetical protein